MSHNPKSQLTKLGEIIATALISDNFTLNRKAYKNKRVRELLISNDDEFSYVMPIIFAAINENDHVFYKGCDSQYIYMEAGYTLDYASPLYFDVSERSEMLDKLFIHDIVTKIKPVVSEITAQTLTALYEDPRHPAEIKITNPSQSIKRGTVFVKEFLTPSFQHQAQWF